MEWVNSARLTAFAHSGRPLEHLGLTGQHRYPNHHASASRELPGPTGVKHFPTLP